MNLNVAIIGRTGSGKSTFLSQISQYKLQVGTRQQVRNIKVSKEIYNLNFNFDFCDTVGFSDQDYLGWSHFNTFKNNIHFFMIFVTLHKQKKNKSPPSQTPDSQKQKNKLKTFSQKSWQDAKYSVQQLTKKWGIGSQNIMVIGNMFTNQKQYELLNTRQLRSYFFSKKIRYYEFDLKQSKEQCQQVLLKVAENRLPSSYPYFYKGITSFTVCLMGQLGSGKSSVCAAMTNDNINLKSTTQNKMYFIKKNYKDSNFVINLMDTPGLDFQDRSTLINISNLEGFDFYIFVMDLSDPNGLDQLRRFFELIISSQWKKDPHNILVIGNKVDIAYINGCEIRRQLLEGRGQRFRFNYVETNSLDKDLTSLCLELLIDIYSNHKIKMKRLQQVEKQKVRQTVQRLEQLQKKKYQPFYSKR